MRTVYGKLTSLIFAVTLVLLLLLPMRYGQEDHLYAYPRNMKVRQGDSQAITYELDSDHAQVITYQSIDESIATVSTQGIVKGISPGATDIRIDAAEGARTLIHVEVQGVATTKVTLNTDSIVMEKGQVTGLSASLNEGADDTRIEWRSEDPEIASVDEAGRVTALRGGRTRVYAVTPGGLRGDAEVLVHVSGDSMRITPEDLTVGTGASLDMGAVFFPDDTTDEVDHWVTSDENLLTVSPSGTIQAVGIGRPVLTAFSGEGLSTSAIINIERSSERFELAPSSVTIERGDTLNLQTRFLNEEGQEDDASSGHYIQWYSSNPDVASVDDTGVAHGIKSGETIISAVVDGMIATCAMKVQVLVHEVTLNENEIFMVKEATVKPLQLVATIRPNDADDPTITWLTSNDLIAKVDANGLVTMTGAYGTAVITARAASGAEAHFTLNVVVKMPTREEAEAKARADAEALEKGLIPE